MTGHDSMTGQLATIGGVPAARRIVDLSLRIESHFRWKVELDLAHDLQKGDVFQTTRMRMLTHAFTHADAPRHVASEGPDIADMDIAMWAGPATILDLSDVAPNTAINADMLERASGHHVAGDIILVRTDWDLRCDITSPDFWQTSPYLTRDGAEWLAARRPRCVGYDFPQDHPIRGIVNGSQADAADFVTHDVLLRAGVGMVEYLVNLASIQGQRTFFVAMPLRIAAGDGSPVRAIAVEF
jgi:kynurenine formamidase